MRIISAKRISKFLPVLDPQANKYSRGVCDLVVGCDRFPGAAVLAARAANRLGSGYVRAYVPAASAAALLTVQPSTVVADSGRFAMDTHVSKVGKPCAVVVGCGFDDSEDSAARTLEVLKLSEAPVVVDGGGLAALGLPEAKDVMDARAARGLATVITPHEGEAARLVEALRRRENAEGREDAEGIAEGREDAERREMLDQQASAEYLARALHAVVVLKGPRTFVAWEGVETPFDIVEDMPDDVESYCGQEPESPVVTSLFYNGKPSLAKAGTGDILAGCVGALLSCGLHAPKACEAAVFLHACAANYAAYQVGEYCVTAEDVLDNLGKAFQAVDKFESASAYCGRWPTIQVDEEDQAGVENALGSLYE